MSDLHLSVVPMQPEDLEAIATITADAFHDNLLYQFVVSDPETRKVFTKEFLTFRIRFGLSKKAAWVTEDRNAVAVWLAPGQGITPPDLMGLGGAAALQKAGEETIQRMTLFTQESSKIEKELAPMPHWFLSPLAVAPAKQKQGYASLLIRHRLDQLDQTGEYAFLDTQLESSEAMYAHFGFKTVWKGLLPGTDVPHIAMLRAPMGK